MICHDCKEKCLFYQCPDLKSNEFEQWVKDHILDSVPIAQIILGILIVYKPELFIPALKLVKNMGQFNRDFINLWERIVSPKPPIANLMKTQQQLIQQNYQREGMDYFPEYCSFPGNHPHLGLVWAELSDKAEFQQKICPILKQIR